MINVGKYGVIYCQDVAEFLLPDHTCLVWVGDVVWTSALKRAEWNYIVNLLYSEEDFWFVI